MAAVLAVIGQGLPEGRPVRVVGTAGHIDHGKSTLIQALTGIDLTGWPRRRRAA